MNLANSYYRVQRAIGLLVPIGTSPSNTWIGSSRAATTCHVPKLFQPRDEIHALVGGTFAVTSSGTVHKVSPGIPPHLFVKDTGAQNWMPLMVKGLVDHGYLRRVDVGIRPADGYHRELPVLGEGFPHRVYPPDRTLKTTAEDILVYAIGLALLPKDGPLPDLMVAYLRGNDAHVATAVATLRDGNGDTTHRLLFSLSRNLGDVRLIDVRGPDDKSIPVLGDRARALPSLPSLPEEIGRSPQVEAYRLLVSDIEAEAGHRMSPG